MPPNSVVLVGAGMPCPYDPQLLMFLTLRLEFPRETPESHHFM
jgi:hypothetical protein